MKCAKSTVRLTPLPAGANSLSMTNEGQGTDRKSAVLLAAVLMGAALLTGCVNVNAPAEPIVIELNVNIKQEVLYRLVDSAEENLEENPEIF